MTFPSPKKPCPTREMEISNTTIKRLVVRINTAIAKVITPKSNNSIELSNGDAYSTYHSVQQQFISLEDWSSIKKEQLPEEKHLSSEQVCMLLPNLKRLLIAYNCPIVFQIYVPERIQYSVIRERFHQHVPVICEDEYFHFSLCDKEQRHEECVMENYCHCKLLDKFFKKYAHIEPAVTEEEDIEDIDFFRNFILKKRYGADWQKYLGLEKD